jgi:hypothetical protein
MVNLIEQSIGKHQDDAEYTGIQRNTLPDTLSAEEMGIKKTHTSLDPIFLYVS